jgi:predicted  nucleic acid-binding Zn-ribbon protein
MTRTSVQALLALQEIDREIYKVGAELKRLPAELAARKADLERAARELEERKKALRELQFTVREIENITTQQRQRLRKIESEAMKSKADVALMAAYEHEIRSLKRNIGQAEEEGLQLVDQAEAAAADVKRIQDTLTADTQVFEELRGNVEKEMADAERRMGTLRSALGRRMQDGIPPEHLSLYRGLLATREGEALAPLDGRFCQGCYVEIPKNLVVRLARGIDLVQCPSCGRILYT